MGDLYYIRWPLTIQLGSPWPNLKRADTTGGNVPHAACSTLGCWALTVASKLDRCRVSIVVHVSEQRHHPPPHGNLQCETDVVGP